MAFVTEYEKRCAAERLRGLPDYETANVVVRTCLGLRPGVLMDKGTRRRLGDFVADLIDPDCDEGRYEGLRTVRPVDREELLRLAEELEGTTRHLNVWQAPFLNAAETRDIARRIREACGVVDAD